MINKFFVISIAVFLIMLAFIFLLYFRVDNLEKRFVSENSEVNSFHIVNVSELPQVKIIDGKSFELGNLGNSSSNVYLPTCSGVCLNIFEEKCLFALDEEDDLRACGEFILDSNESEVQCVCT